MEEQIAIGRHKKAMQETPLDDLALYAGQDDPDLQDDFQTAIERGRTAGHKQAEADRDWLEENIRKDERQNIADWLSGIVAKNYTIEEIAMRIARGAHVNKGM